jgi:hypothetical protein
VPSHLRANKERIGFVLFLTIIGSLVWLTHSSAFNPADAVNGQNPIIDTSPKGQSAASCPTCSPAKERMIYAPLIDLPESSGSEIVLNCRSSHELPVTPIFYTLDGESYTGKEIVLKPAEIHFVDTKSLIPAKERDRHKWGGMAFSYYGGFMEAWAQLTLHGIRGGGSVTVLFTVLSQKRSNSAEAVWWTPRGGSGAIALGNSSDQYVHANLIFASGGSQSVDVRPNATEIVRLRSDINVLGKASGRVEAVSINYTGPEGSLISTGYTSSDDGKFASMIRFYDSQHVVQQNLFANNLRLKDTTQHMVLRNVSADFITATPTFLPPNGDASHAVKLQSVRLSPSQVVEVDLAPLRRAALSRSELDSVSVQVSNTGKAGSLIGALYSVNSQTEVTYDVPLRDSGPPRASTGGYPIRLDGDYSTVITITNTTDTPGDFTMQINYDGGPYVMGLFNIAPGATKVFDVRKIRDAQTPDLNGKPLPRDLKVAQAKWSIRHNIRLNGRAEVVSLRDGVSTSYSCSLCCPNTFGAGWISPINYGDCPTSVGPGSTTQFTAFEQDFNGPYCGGTGSPYPVGATWQSEDESIATVDYTGLATAIGPGYGVVSCYWDVVYWTWDDIDESCEEDIEPYEANDCMQVYDVRILRDSSNITGTTTNVIVGQQINLSVQLLPSGTTASSIQWTVPGTRVQDYVASSSTGTVTSLSSLTSSSISYAWVDGADGRQVTLAVTISGTPFTKTATFNVKRPTASITTSTGSVVVGTGWGDTELSFGVDPSHHGIDFSRSITIPSGFSGSTEWIQLATPLRRRQLNSGTWERWEGSGLDTQYPYPELSTGVTADSPGEHMTSDLLQDTADDSFEMWLMFKPTGTGSIWVPLRKVSWSWSGAASRSGSTWTLNSSSHSTNPSDADSTTHPTWTRNTTSNSWQTEH